MSINKIKYELLRLPRSIKRSLVIFLDIVCALFCVWMLLGLQLNQWGILSGNQWWAAVAAIGISIPIFMHFGRIFVQMMAQSSFEIFMSIQKTYPLEHEAIVFIWL